MNHKHFASNNKRFDVAALTLNPAVDLTVSIENFQRGEVNTVQGISSFPGGKGVNVACALADYGLKTAVSGFLGQDNIGAFEELFSQKGINDRFVRIKGQTRVGIKITDSLRGETTDINLLGPKPTASDLKRLDEQISNLEARWFVLAGSLTAGVDPGFYQDLTDCLKSYGQKVALDTSGEALELALRARPSLIKPNLREVEALLGVTLSTESDVIKVARGLVDQGIELVIISMGSKGACYATEHESLFACPPEVEALSTVGAGDAMVAGTIAACLRGLDLTNTARMATAFSLEALKRIGPGISNREAIEASMGQITIHKQ